MSKDEFGLNKNSIANESDTYIETLVINGKMINVFSSDPGQCYWFQWLGDDGELLSHSCGTYNPDYKEGIEYFFTPRIDRISEQLNNLNIKYIDLARDVADIKDLVEKWYKS